MPTDAITGKESARKIWERHIHAFVELCKESGTRPVKHDDQSEAHLSGLTIGVKDIIDVRGIPTRNGSKACHHARPAAADAAVVATLRNAGASIVGKTTTTEFAFTDPTDCRNPYDLTRTPGGSSSGSAAAVAAGMVDMALGTQTAGSLCRPAAYCGVVGLKPSYGALPTTGVTPLSKSFDTVGIISRSVDIARRCFMVMSNLKQQPFDDEPRVASILLPTSTVATADTLDAFHSASLALKELSVSVEELVIESNIVDLVGAHRTIMNAEAAHTHASLLHPENRSLLRPKFRAGIEAGARVSAIELEDARCFLSQAKTDFWSQLAPVDIILTLPVPDAAPTMDGTTGFQDWLTPWTVFGGPLVCLPWGMDRLGRPRSVMLAAQPGQDTQTLAMAQRLEQLAPLLPPPAAPGHESVR